MLCDEQLQAVALGLDLLALVEQVGDVAVGDRHAWRRAAARRRRRPSCRRCPSPCSASSSRRAGRLSLSGTVSMCPAITTRSSRPWWVRATTVCPKRCTSRWSSPRRAASTASAISLLVAADRLDVDEVLGQLDGVHGRGQVAMPPIQPAGRRSGPRHPASVALRRDPTTDRRRPASAPTAAWGYGLATYAGTEGEDGVLDTGTPPRGSAPPTRTWRPRAELTRLEGVDEVRGVAPARGPHRRRATCRPPRPTPRTRGCGCTCSATGWSRPHTVSLDGIFGLLANVVWTDAGPCAVDGLRDDPAAAHRGARPRHRARGRQVPPDDRLRAARPASGSPTPTGSGSARTSPRARPSCTRGS